MTRIPMTIGSETATRFPLSWPSGWTRTRAGDRRRARFFSTSMRQSVGGNPYKSKEALSVSAALQRLQGELGRLGTDNEILSTNLPVKLDGFPRSNQANAADPGVAIYFRLKKKARVLACDRWDRVADNIAAIAAHIETIRAQERYGVGNLEQAFAGYAALPADTAADWRSVFGFNGDPVTAEQLNARFRERARTAHPDVGGTDEGMAHLNRARDYALQELLS